MSALAAQTNVPATAGLADVIARGLAAAGTRTLYGVPGGGNNLDVIGACERHGLTFILTHGETAAAVMAGVDGELNGAPGACVVTRGPGAASAVNGVAQALLDRQPLIVLTDAVSAADRPRVSHQRIDQDALFAPVTKWSASVGTAGAEDIVAAAIRIACEPPQGPVHLAYVPDGTPPEAPAAAAAPAAPDFAAAERLLAEATNPLLAVGVGARQSVAALRRLLDGRAWPVLTTYKAKGFVPESAANAAGLLTGATIEAPPLREADLVVTVGLDPVEFIPAPWPYDAPVLTLGEWPLEDRYFDPAVELVGPLAELLAFVAAHAPPGTGRAIREQRLARDAAVRVAVSGLAPHDVVEQARSVFPAGTIATIDAGAHMLVAMPLWEVDEPGEVLISSGLATMGFALPAAIAAALARPDRRVVCFIGDGGLGMALAELETISRLGVPITVVVFNDSALSLIEIKQASNGQGGPDAVRYRPIDFAAIAAGFGIEACTATDVDGVHRALRAALSESRPFLVDATVDPTGYRAVLAAVRGGTR